MIQLPIEHLSYSSMRSFCSNPWLFKKNYILNVWDIKITPAMLVGKGFHKFAECLYSGMDQSEANRKAFELVDQTSDKEVEWGKTGSREKVMKELAQVIDIFMSHRDDYGISKATEYKRVVTPTIDGSSFPLPLKAVTDYVSEIDSKLHMWDWKVVTSFTDKEEEQSDYIMQAMFNFFTVSMGFSIEPEDMTFVEIKKSLSKNGEKQIEYYRIVFNDHPEYFKYFAKMYVGVIEQLSNPNYVFLPNFSDLLSKKESWNDFTAEIMDFSMPEQISHKSPIKQNVEKRFVESKINDSEALQMTPQEKIISKMLEFGVPLEYEKSYIGANVSLYAFKPSRAVKMSKIEGYEQDLQLALETKSTRILAPIPGEKFIGIEVPNEEQKIVNISSAPLPKSSLELPIGIDVYGNHHSIDLAKAPHLLVAGSTGAGKSVSLSGFIQTLTKHNTTADLGLILIDPKRSEFVEYEDNQHLLSSIITENEDANVALKWAVGEMEKRYKTLKEAKVKNIDAYRASGGDMQKIVIIIDELADLLLSSTEERNEIEKSIVRIAQKARAVGIHLIIATQRPSVDVVTGILKANFPTRLAFMTATQIDSKVILDQSGAEKLIGNGDCLLMQPTKDLIRLQGYFTE